MGVKNWKWDIWVFLFIDLKWKNRKKDFLIPKPKFYTQNSVKCVISQERVAVVGAAHELEC